jgi:hypothetical protein
MTTTNYPIPFWMRNTPLEDTFLNDPDYGWYATGDPRLAMEAVRRDPAYDEIFPGNRREDGTLRYTEDQYFGIIESYEDSLLAINLNPDLFRNRFSGLLAGLVSPVEFAGRVENVYEQVIESAPQVAAYYANTYGLDMTPEAIIASVLDPDIGDSIVNRRIAISQVGGAASARDFTIGKDLAERLVNYGVDTLGEAQTYFAEAASVQPVLDVLARRHADPDDDFDLEEFSSAAIFGDPEQRRRMRRLMAQERAEFGPDTALSIRQNRSGSLTGLEQQ